MRKTASFCLSLIHEQFMAHQMKSNSTPLRFNYQFHDAHAHFHLCYLIQSKPKQNPYQLSFKLQCKIENLTSLSCTRSKDKAQEKRPQQKESKRCYVRHLRFSSFFSLSLTSQLFQRERAHERVCTSQQHCTAAVGNRNSHSLATTSFS